MATTLPSDLDPRTQLMPNLVDHYANVKPDAIWAEYPNSASTYEDGYYSITYGTFANAINGVAKWLTETLGRGQGEILAYIGPNDMRYLALVLGAVKAGYCMFFTSPRNSAAAHKKLFENLNCTKLLVPSPRPASATVIFEAQQVDVYEVPTVEDLLSTKYPHFEYTKTYLEAANQPLAVIHTSGSTGMPKPIIWTLDTPCKHLSKTYLDVPDGYENVDSWLEGKRAFLSLPPFHAGGLGFLLFVGVHSRMTIICPRPGGVPTAAGLVDAMRQTLVEIAIVVPSLVQELAQDAELLDYCAQKLTRIMYCGGDLPQLMGDKVASKVHLVNMYGSSETGFLSSIYSNTKRNLQKDWRYIHFNPRQGTELRHVSDQQYELFMLRTPEYEAHQMPFTIFRDRQEYGTRDLWVRHSDPDKSNLWRWSSRADDMIVFLNGEKTNPISTEQHITASNSEVSAVLVAGAQRFQASLIIELKDKRNLSASERAAAIERIWPSIEEANRICPAHARIARTHILFTHPDRPLPRASKGTVQRAGAMDFYSKELEALYTDADHFLSREVGAVPGPGQVGDANAISDYLRQSISSVGGLNNDKLDAEANFFHLGLDSLQAITVARWFKHGLGLPGFTPNLIYLHPSISQLTQAILQLQKDDHISTEATKAAELRERDSLLQELLNQLSPTSTHTVILTGSSGRLGTYLLGALLKNPLVAHVHCLNRRPDSATIQSKNNIDYGLNTPLDSSRVSFWTADLAQTDFGLQAETLRAMQDTATLVIHNAWAVNFNLSLASFKPNLSSVLNFINFCSGARKKPHLFFISSISSVMGHHAEPKCIPEAVITTDSPAPNGYASSKYLAEQLLSEAAQQGSVCSSIVRVGQVAGAVQSAGLWNKAEWFPSLILSSLHVGAVPETIGTTMGRIDWVPIDLLADVLVELAFKRSGRLINVYHPVNLHPVDWETIRPWVIEALWKRTGRRLESVPLQSWIERVRQDMESTRRGEALDGEELQVRLEKNPAAKLLDFFEAIASNKSGTVNMLDTQFTKNKSQKLQKIGAVQPEWIDKWVSEWLQ